MILERKRALVGTGNRVLYVADDDNHLLAHCSQYADYPGVSSSGVLAPDHYLTDCIVIVGTDSELAQFKPI